MPEFSGKSESYRFRCGLSERSRLCRPLPQWYIAAPFWVLLVSEKSNWSRRSSVGRIEHNAEESTAPWITRNGSGSSKSSCGRSHGMEGGDLVEPEEE